MPNPRAQRQVALNSAVDNLKELAKPARALGDMLAGTLRGSVAATAGVGGDIRELVDLFGPEAVEQVLGKRVMPTTEEVKQFLPKATNYDNPYESIGEFLPLPGTGAALKAAGYGLGRAAGAGTRAAGQAVSDAMIHQAGPLAKGPLSALAPRMAMTNVVKPKDGNWLGGNVEKSVKPLKRNEKAAENLEEMRRVYPPEALATMSEETRASVDRAFPHLEQEAALNKWVDRNLTGYMKKEMGTPEDPVRALFEKRTQDIESKYAKAMEKSARLEQRAQSEQDPRRVANLMRESQQVAADAAAERDLLMKHITHFPANEIEFANAWIPEQLGTKRFKAGYPATGMGESPAAKAWETMADNQIYGATAGEYAAPLTPLEIRRGDKSVLDTDPWIAKLDPQTRVYHTESDNAASELGFDHVLDVLRQDVASGRIRPEQLNKVSMEQAVQRAAEYDLEMARKMRDAVISQQEGFPVHKDYGDQGYKWIELAPSKEKKTYTAENLPEGFELEKDRDGYYQVRNYNVGMSPTTNSFSRKPEEAIAKFNKWAEDKDFDLQRALEYEGKTMGHCVGGYCPDVLEGRSRIFSLRDKRGEPHVTVEVRPNPHPIGTSRRGDEFPELSGFEYGGPYSGESPYKPSKEQLQQIHNRAQELWSTKGTGLAGDVDRFYQQASNEILGSMPEQIIQIKGKGNAKPKENYIPFVQDFVRGGKWTKIGDLHNADLIPMGKDKYVTQAEAKEQFEPRAKKALEFLQTHPAFEEQRAAKAQKMLDDYDFDKQRELEKIYGQPLFPGSSYSATELASIIKNPEEWTDSLNDYYPSLNRWLEEAEKGMQHYKYGLPEEGMAAGGAPNRYPTEQERETMRKLRESFLPAVKDAERLKRLRDSMERAEQKKVSFSDNPDTMMMELGELHMSKAGAVADALKAAKAAVKAEGELTLPSKLPRAKPRTKEELRPYAQQMAEATRGDFYRPDPAKSVNPAGKSFEQWKMEQGLVHDIRPTAKHQDLPRSDIEKQKGMVKMGISGDTTVAEKVLHEAGPYALDIPSPQHGGALYGLGGEGAWASNNPIAENVQKRINEISQAYGDAPVLGQYMQMGKLGSDFALHFADANLRAIDLSKMTNSQIEAVNDLIRKGSKKSGERPSFPGIEDKESAYLHFAVDPELRKHFNAIMQKPTYTEPLGLPDGRIIHHAITEPELRDLPVTTTGFSQMELNPGFDPSSLPLSAHPTYSNVIPHKPQTGLTRTPVHIPAPVEFPDVTEYLTKTGPRIYDERDMTRMYQTSTPRQIVDQQHIDEIKMFEELMKEYGGKKEGGAIHVKPKKMAAGGELTAEDLEIEERPL